MRQPLGAAPTVRRPSAAHQRGHELVELQVLLAGGARGGKHIAAAVGGHRRGRQQRRLRRIPRAQPRKPPVAVPARRGAGCRRRGSPGGEQAVGAWDMVRVRVKGAGISRRGRRRRRRQAEQLMVAR